MTQVIEPTTPAKIRELRRAILIFCFLFVLWWIIECFNFAGSATIDALDVGGIAIVAAGGWLVMQAWQTRCPGCGNRFFVSSALPLWFHLSSECPYCKQSVYESD